MSQPGPERLRQTANGTPRREALTAWWADDAHPDETRPATEYEALMQTAPHHEAAETQAEWEERVEGGSENMGLIADAMDTLEGPHRIALGALIAGHSAQGIADMLHHYGYPEGDKPWSRQYAHRLAIQARDQVQQILLGHESIRAKLNLEDDQ